MTQKLGTLGLALMVVFALGAVVASAAQAEKPGLFTAGDGVYPSAVHGEQVSGLVTGKTTEKFELKMAAGIFRCTPVTFTGTLTKESSELTIEPTIGNTTTGAGCTIAGVAGAIVHMNGCDYLFTLTRTGTAFSAETHLKCPVGKHIEVTFGNCDVTFFEHTFPASQITLVNGGTATDMHVTATFDLAEVTYEFDFTNGAKEPCGLGVKAGVLTKDGTYKGVATFHNMTVS